MGRKMNNMPARKSKKDKNNPQIRGKAGFGRTRTKCRVEKQKERSKEDMERERGQVPQRLQEPQERARPESYLELSKRQEDRVSADVEPAEEQEESKRARRKRLRAEAEAKDKKKNGLMESNFLPKKDLREGTVDLAPDEEEGGTLAEHRPAARKASTASYRPSFCAAGVCTGDSQQGELWPRATVRLAGLQAAPELNGRTASCSSWDRGKERWLVRLEGSTETKALKPGNLRLLAPQDGASLRPGSCVRILGLKGAAALNGEQGTCITWDKAKERWLVRLQNSLERLLRPENLKLHGTQEATVLRTGSSVCIAGLQAAPELNGKQGTCLDWDEAKKRWRVRLEGGIERLLKPENLEVESTPEELLVSPLVSQAVTFCKKEEKPEQLVQLLRRLRQEERKGLRPRGLTAVFCRDAESIQVVREALLKADLPNVVLHWELTKPQRDSALAAFRLDGKAIALVTDDACHGLKSEHLRFVVNYDFPRGLAQYGDRIRRTLRQGAEGGAHSLFTKASARLAPGLVAMLDAARASVEPALRELAAKRQDRKAGSAKTAAGAGATPGKPINIRKTWLRKGLQRKQGSGKKDPAKRLKRSASAKQGA